MRTKCYAAVLAALLLGTATFAQQEEKVDPYATLGYSPYVIGADRESNAKNAIFVISNTNDGTRLEHNPKTGIVMVFNKDGNAIGQVQLKEEDRAFTTIDPLAEKYYNISPYAYAANNPILYVDRDGRSIDVSWLQQIDKDHGANYTQMLINDWSSQTGLTYSISDAGIVSYATDDNGSAIVATDGNGVEVGSAYARNFLTGAIDHADVITFTGGSQTQIRPLGSNVIVTNPNEINGYINGSIGVDNRTFGWGMIMMHELHHTGVGGSMSDTPYNDTYPGPVVTQMNVIRSELNAKGGNYGRRKSYESTGIFGTGHYVLPFDNVSKAAIGRGIAPVLPMPGQSRIKYIKHK